VRKDLNTGYAAVQAGHAVAEWLIEHPEPWKNEYLIYLSIPTELDIDKWAIKLEKKNLDFVVFREPDLGDEKTALAVVCDGKMFSHLPLFS